MAVTSSQITSILQISSEASLINGAATITDVSAYGSIGVAVPDVVKVIFQILDPTGDVFYENPGYLTADYTSPDLLPLTTPVDYSFTLPTYTTGDYVQGEYTVNYKVQVTQGSDITEAYKALYMNVCGCCNAIVADVQGSVSYNTAVVSVTDFTNYKTWTALTNVLTLYPPTNTDTAQTLTAHGSPATLVYTPPVGTFPYTGTWQWTLVSTISYSDNISGTTTTCQLTAQGSFQVLQSQLCKVRCLLDKYRTEMYARIKVRSNPALERNYLFAEADFLMALASERCALPQTTIDKYITNIYLLTGIDPDCECGCSDGVSQPLVPTSSINGTDGTDGSQIYNGTTVPSNGLGAVGDYYIRTTNGFLYEKTGATTWTYVMTLVGATGATGATGASGTSLIFSGPLVSGVIDSVATTTNGSYETLSSFSTDHTNDAKNLVNVGDSIKLYACFEMTDNPMTGPIGAQLLINGTGLSNLGLTGLFAVDNANASQVEFDSEIILKDNASGAMELRINSIIKVWSKGLLADSILYQSKLTAFDLGGATVDFSANDYSISAQAKSVATGDISLQIYQAEKLAITNSAQSPSTSIKYITPFTTTAGVQSYANVVGNAASNIVRVYLDGVLLTSADWTYTQATDTLLFNISITGASEVAADYV